MLPYALRCYRVPVRVGKAVRHAIRRHWNVGHHAAHVIYHGGIVAGTMLVCVAVPAALWAFPPAAVPPEIAAPPLEIIPPIAPLPAIGGGEEIGPGQAPSFVPGPFYYPPLNEINDFGPQKERGLPDHSPSPERLLTENAPQDVLLSVTSVTHASPIVQGIDVPEPASILVFLVGVVVLLLIRRRAK